MSWKFWQRRTPQDNLKTKIAEAREYIGRVHKSLSQNYGHQSNIEYISIPNLDVKSYIELLQRSHEILVLTIDIIDREIK